MTRRATVFSLLLFLVFSVCFFRQLGCDALFTHLAAGEHIQQTLALRVAEPFTYLHAGKTWYNLFWLSDLGLFLFFSIAGFGGLWLLPWFAYWKTSAVLAYDHESWWPLCAVVVCVVFATYPYLSPGPHNFSSLFAAVLLYILATPRRKTAIWWLLPLQILWTNCHPSFVFVPFTVLLYFLARSVQSRWQTPLPWLPIVAVFACTLVSPHGYAGIWKAFVYCRQQQSISLWEWPGYWIALAAGSIALWTMWQKAEDEPPLPELLLWICWLSFSGFYAGWTLAYSLLNAFLLARCLSLYRDKSGFVSGKTARFLLVGGAVVLVTAAPLGMTDFRWGWGLDSHRCPIGAADFVERSYSGKLFNDPTLGGYLSWRGHKVFMDGRKLRYFREDFRDLEDARQREDAFLQLARRLDITLAIFDHRLPQNRDLLRFLSLDETWKMVHCDHIAVVFSTSANEKLARTPLEDGEVPALPLSCRRCLYARSRFLLAIEWVTSARQDYRRAIALAEQAETREAQRHFLEACFALLDGDLEAATENLAPLSRRRFHRKSWLQLLLQYLRVLDVEDESQRQFARKWALFIHGQAPSPDTELFLAYLTDIEGDRALARDILVRASKRYPDHEGIAQYLADLEKTVAERGLQTVLASARIHRLERRYRSALKILRDGIEKYPKAMQLYLERGKVYRAVTRYDEACDDFRRVLHNAPNQLSARCQLAQTLTEMGEWRQAMKELSPLLSSKEHSIRSDVRQSLLKIEEVAVPALRQSIAAEPKNYSLRKQLADILVRVQKFGEAIEALAGVAVEDREFHSSLHYRYAQNLINEAKVTEAMAQLDDAIQVWPQYLDAYALLGEIHLQRFELEKARELYERMVEIAPEDLRGREGLALVEYGKGIQLQSEGELAKAIRYFEKYLELAPDEEHKDSITKEDVKKRIANIRIKFDEEQRRQKQESILALFDAALEAMKDKRWDEAIAAYRRVIALDPQSVEAHWNLSEAIRRRILDLKSKDKALYDEMERALQRVIALRPNFADAHLHLGHLYLFRQSKSDAARTHYRKFLQLIDDPQSRTAKRVRQILEELE